MGLFEDKLSLMRIIDPFQNACCQPTMRITPSSRPLKLKTGDIRFSARSCPQKLSRMKSESTCSLIYACSLTDLPLLSQDMPQYDRLFNEIENFDRMTVKYLQVCRDWGSFGLGLFSGDLPSSSSEG